MGSRDLVFSLWRTKKKKNTQISKPSRQKLERHQAPIQRGGARDAKVMSRREASEKDRSYQDIMKHGQGSGWGTYRREGETKREGKRVYLQQQSQNGKGEKKEESRDHQGRRW